VKGRKRWGWGTLIAGAFLSGAALVGIALFWPQRDDRPVPAASSFTPPAPPASAGPGDNPVSPSPGPRLAIVIDDLGYEPVRDAEWLDFPGKITVSVIPFGPSSRTFAASARSRGHGVILHVPMEPESPAEDRTASFRLRRGMRPEEMEEAFSRMAQDVPQANGASNHMGSAFTSDAGAMAVFAGILKRRGFFFVDSLTIASSVGLEAAGRAGVPAVRRDVFLDDDPGPEEMRRQWEKALALAKERGEAVIVCHSRRETRKALLELLPGLRAEGIRPVTVEELLETRVSR
jgi:polysaccharide deacetylase 2 family uncharacterized protein YibQ